jgi:hypothetical protein
MSFLISIIIATGLCAGVLLLSLYAVMIVVRPIQLAILARKHGLSYKWLEISKVKGWWFTYEVKKNLLQNKTKKLLIYDTSFYPYNTHFHLRRTVVLANKSKYELTDFMLGYANISKIEECIKKVS